MLARENSHSLQSLDIREVVGGTDRVVLGVSKGMPSEFHGRKMLQLQRQVEISSLQTVSIGPMGPYKPRTIETASYSVSRRVHRTLPLISSSDVDTLGAGGLPYSRRLSSWVRNAKGLR